MPIFKAVDRPGKSIKTVINYAAKDAKKEKDDTLFFGINCADNPAIATYQMGKTKELYNKTDGRQYKHYVLSFANNEIKVDDAKNYAKKLAQKCFGNRFEVAVGLHVNSAGKKIHAHFVVNSVSFIDGRKLHFSKNDLENFKLINDQIAQKYGLKIIDRSHEAVKARGRPQMYSQREYQQFCKKTKESWLAQCAVAVHKTLQNNPKDFADFAQQMKVKGWHAHVRGKNITFVNIDDKNKKIRANTLARKLNNDSLMAANIMRTCNAENWRDFTKMQKQKTQIKTPKTVSKTNAAATLKNIARRGNTTTKGGMRVRLRDNEEYEI
mgnify:CR=1 FL=1